jgi:AbrB family looped-hinge helix DNA binding protein
MSRRSLPFGTTTVTSKGQLTIPIAIRRWLGLGRGTLIELRIETGELHARLLPHPQRRPRQKGEEVTAR